MSHPTLFEQLIASQQAAVDTFLALANSALNSSEKITNLNISTVRSSLADQFTTGKHLFAAKDVQEAIALHSALLQPQIEKLVAYNRSLYELSAEAQGELLKLFEGKHSELNHSVSSALDWYAKSSGNADIAVAAVKSAISAANSAFENVNKAARQVADIADASVSAATSATVRAVGNGTALKKKAA